MVPYTDMFYFPFLSGVDENITYPVIDRICPAYEIDHNNSCCTDWAKWDIVSDHLIFRGAIIDKTCHTKYLGKEENTEKFL